MPARHRPHSHFAEAHIFRQITDMGFACAVSSDSTRERKTRHRHVLRPHIRTHMQRPETPEPLAFINPPRARTETILFRTHFWAQPAAFRSPTYHKNTRTCPRVAYPINTIHHSISSEECHVSCRLGESRASQPLECLTRPVNLWLTALANNTRFCALSHVAARRLVFDFRRDGRV